jgi:serine/threonine-protein kinase RsbW
MIFSVSDRRDSRPSHADTGGWSRGGCRSWRAALLVSGVINVQGPGALSVPGLTQMLPIIRAEHRRWTEAADLDVDLAHDIILAVNEAAANAIEHADRTPRERPTTVVVFAGQVQPGGMVYVVVSDHGRWQPPSIEDSIRGRGISMVKALADRFALHHDETGTTVLLGWLL